MNANGVVRIIRDIYVENPNIRWSDIAGLTSSKRLVRESVVYPMKFPHRIAGTGKTLLAKAVATECKTTFFNISASSIVSKWRGDSEKLVRVLFELARYHSPSTIFMDELEALMSHRTSDGAEHEGSRRMKTELLIQMDGLAKTKECVFLLAASNLPWDLDIAMLRRLEKRNPGRLQILIDLPDEEARSSIFRINLPQNTIDTNGNLLVSELQYETLAALSEGIDFNVKHDSFTPSGYSGADIQLVCKEAAMRPLRRLFDLLESSDAVNETLPAEYHRAPVTMADVQAALQTTRPSTNPAQTGRYRLWQTEFGAV
ncbi:Katanin p60 ATPase-containing subunit A-like 2 [Entophlyctis sp. JEL0112]|nr:Katanin p60 ATPase-containing subunit A-like 2 [Entophlyctis sp. JEL0112]